MILHFRLGYFLISSFNYSIISILSSSKISSIIMDISTNEVDIVKILFILLLSEYGLSVYYFIFKVLI